MQLEVPDIMSDDEHDLLDKLIVVLYEHWYGLWPPYEEVIKDHEVATRILCLVVRTTAPQLALKAEWTDSRNIYALSKQKLVRESLSNAVRWKTFIRMRSLSKSSGARLSV